MSSYYVLLPMISFEEIQTKWFLFSELNLITQKMQSCQEGIPNQASLQVCFGPLQSTVTAVLQFWHFNVVGFFKRDFGLKGRR